MQTELNNTMRVVCAILEYEHQFLVCQKLDDQMGQKVFEFPGGKIEKGETEFDAIIREIDEELSLVCQPYRIGESVFKTKGDIQIELIPVWCKCPTQDFTLHEHLDAIWLTKAQLQSLNWSSGDDVLVKQIK